MSAEVKSDNELIAEFMGATPCEIEVKSIGTMPGYECEEFKLTVDELEYHTSWDWLMPVVEKIAETHDFTIQFYAGDCNCYCTKQNYGASEIPGIGHGGFKPHIQSVYKSVVALIKHINKP